MKKLLPIMLLLAACSATAPVPSPVIERTPTGLVAGELATAVWTAKPQVLRLRQTARFTFRGREVPMIGLMELDTRRSEARLVAVNELGVKLFDLTVSEGGVVENYLLPQLALYPGFSTAVATSLRRIFLAPDPQPEVDVLQEAAEGYLLSGERKGEPVVFLFGGDPVRLVEKSVLGRKDDWRVVYLDYQQMTSGLPYPRDIVLEDRRAGYRLDLRIESIAEVGDSD